MIDSLGFISDILSCAILVLVMRFVRQKTSLFGEVAEQRYKVNRFVTGSHICVTLAFATSQIMFIFAKKYVTIFRMASAFIVLAGASDLFLSLILWFIFND